MRYQVGDEVELAATGVDGAPTTVSGTVVDVTLTHARIAFWGLNGGPVVVPINHADLWRKEGSKA